MMRYKNENMVVRFNWGASVIISTLLVIALFVFLLYTVLTHSGIWQKVFSLGIIIVTTAGCLAYCPRYLYWTGDAVIIKRVVGRVVIPLNHIIEARDDIHITYFNTVRTFGNGGYFGYTGYCYTPQIGHFIMYATQLKNYVFIRTVHKNYVVTCVKSTELVRKIQEAIDKNR